MASLWHTYSETLGLRDLGAHFSDGVPSGKCDSLELSPVIWLHSFRAAGFGVRLWQIWRGNLTFVWVYKMAVLPLEPSPGCKELVLGSSSALVLCMVFAAVESSGGGHGRAGVMGIGSVGSDGSRYAW